MIAGINTILSDENADDNQKMTSQNQDRNQDKNQDSTQDGTSDEESEENGESNEISPFTAPLSPPQRCPLSPLSTENDSVDSSKAETDNDEEEPYIELDGPSLLQSLKGISVENEIEIIHEKDHRSHDQRFDTKNCLSPKVFHPNYSINLPNNFPFQDSDDVFGSSFTHNDLLFTSDKPAKIPRYC
jgi:transcriptional regulator of acetoin/glycerol metabolism